MVQWKGQCRSHCGCQHISADTHDVEYHDGEVHFRIIRGDSNKFDIVFFIIRSEITYVVAIFADHSSCFRPLGAGEE